jgi:hypothetical protein
MTMAQLKEHPGLQLDIPGLDYRMSSPVPIPPMQDPIDPDLVDEAIVEDLVQLGFESEDDVRVQLRQTGDNDVKVFYHMMHIRVIGVRAYPWSSIDDLPSSPPEFFEFPGRGEDAPGVPPFEEGLENATDLDSPVEDMVWESVGGADEESSDVASKIEDIGLKIEEVMSRLRRLFKSEGYQQFHPTPLETVTGDAAADQYLVVKASFTSKQTISISVEHIPADPIRLSDWMRKIGYLLADPSILTGSTC